MADNQQVFLYCLRHLLRPVVKFCLGHSIKLQQFLETAKEVFVEIGEEELESQDSASSVSRIAIMTGVHRKDVTRLKQPERESERTVDIFTRVVGQWKNDPRFSNRKGSPRALNYSGKESEFADLVRSVSKELNPYTILFELERLQLVNRKEDTVQLRANEYVPAGDLKESFSLLGNDVASLIAAVRENVGDTGKEPNLHLTTRYDNIVPDALPTIRKWFLAQGEKLHRQARNFLSKFDKDINPKLATKEGGAQVTLGTFSFTETPTTGKAHTPEETEDKS